MTSLCNALDHFEPALQLEEALRKTAAPSPWPGLTDASKRTKAIALARENGLFERLAERLVGQGAGSAYWGISPYSYASTPQPHPIKRLDWSAICEYHRTGKWRDGEIISNALARIQDEALALWLDHPSADAGRLEETLWAFCDFEFWMPQESAKLHGADLTATTCGAVLSELLLAVGDRLDTQVVRRVGQRIEERSLNAALDWRNLPIWMFR
ncbi:MAG: hypothetical protein NTZ08_14175, partial [Verrucomicrobia bacterium]|nr:hypothetical protein [Verrucomicrobiota bacterium]